MGKKKGKVGKARKDKYYHLAKETGYRARSAFKLLQLNRKFQFLERSRVCIDLCAAPGGWLQVCQQNMPISSLVIGVDLFPIKPIHNVVTLTEDITTESCKQKLQKELQKWKADVVLHDGAPNVGMNWLHDAFQQAQLTLQALKLATNFLKKGGWFITKVFRSKDYNALLWVFKQLFKSVHATKPMASRNESAEVFVVCRQYKAPDKIDPKFLDVKAVFKDVSNDKKPSLNLIHPEKVKKKAEGYEDENISLTKQLKASQYLLAENFLEILASTHEIVIDTDEIRNHPLTTLDITESCKDIRVLSKREIRLIVNWRKKLKRELYKEEEKPEDTVDNKKSADGSSDSEAEDKQVMEEIAKLEEEQRKAKKRKRRKVMKEKRKLRDGMELKMVHPGDHIQETDDINLFNLKKIKSKQGLETVQREELVDEEYEKEDDDMLTMKTKHFMYSEDHVNEISDFSEDDDDVEDDDMEAYDDVEDQDDVDEDDIAHSDEEEENPLLEKLEHVESRDSQAKRKTQMWFKKDTFAGLEQDSDEDLMIEKMAADYRKKGGVIIGEKNKTSKRKHTECEDDAPASDQDSSDDESDIDFSDDDSGDNSDDTDSDYDVHANFQRNLQEQKRGEKQASKGSKSTSEKNGFEVVAPAAIPSKIIKLDPVELALGEELIKSSKRRREIEEMSYNRYTHGEEDLPDWFEKDERIFCRKRMPVSKEQIDGYKEQMKVINARPIKKVAEANARKRKKIQKKLERVRKKAETVTDENETSDGEKWKQIKDIYKRAGLLNKKKREATYVIAKRGGGKKPTRPAGVKGFYKVVDPRMKKDNVKEKRGGKAGKGTKQSKGRPSKGGPSKERQSKGRLSKGKKGEKQRKGGGKR